MSPTALTQIVVDPPENGSGRRSSRRGEPVWELALRYPVQGDWTERDYFAADLEGLVELVDGCVEVLPMTKLVGFDGCDMFGPRTEDVARPSLS